MVTRGPIVGFLRLRVDVGIFEIGGLSHFFLQLMSMPRCVDRLSDELLEGACKCLGIVLSLIPLDLFFGILFSALRDRHSV